jgi:hypothetical protein
MDSLLGGLVGPNPDDETQLLALILSGNLPAARSGYINTYHHGGPRFLKGILRRHHEKAWSGPVEPSSCDRQIRLRFCPQVVIYAHPKQLRGQRLHFVLVPLFVRRPFPDRGFRNVGPSMKSSAVSSEKLDTLLPFGLVRLSRAPVFWAFILTLDSLTNPT